MGYEFTSLKTELCSKWRAGDKDANGQRPERATSDGAGNPCRHCLQDIPAGQEMLILAHRPFKILNPYAEVGPIFICADCERHPDGAALPPVMAVRPRHLMKGYSDNDRIAPGTGEIVQTLDIPAYIKRTFNDPDVAYIDVRSDTNNCFTVRINRQIH